MHGLPRARKAQAQTKRTIDIFAYLVSFASLFFTLDQVRLAWSGDVAGISVLAWSFYSLSSIVWLMYGYVHHDRALIITNAVWVVMSFAVVAGLFFA